MYIEGWKGDVRKMRLAPENKLVVIPLHICQVECTPLIHKNRWVDNSSIYLLNSYYVLEIASVHYIN